uniref:uncharacterized protein LOC120330410 n=1 Tax=Styela clava TaxID=7725 RepID=UPI0019396D44|nr:uncharacterized protein LOC120330410 [Styela clava]
MNALFSGPEESCTASNHVKQHHIDHIDRPKTSCSEKKCIQRSHFASTKCTRVVKLYKPYVHRAVQCKIPDQHCDHEETSSEHLYPSPNDHVQKHNHDQSSNLYSSPMKSKHESKGQCRCSTIWCYRSILAIYKNYGKLYKGNVDVKIPCGCDCRKHNNHNFPLL